MEHVMMFRLRAATLIAVLAFALCPSGSSAKDYPPNELPMFGGVTKNAAMIQADNDFIATVLAKGVTRAQGSDKMVVLGWQYFFQHDYTTAMKRFNQAWLLDPDNGDLFMVLP